MFRFLFTLRYECLFFFFKLTVNHLYLYRTCLLAVAVGGYYTSFQSGRSERHIVIYLGDDSSMALCNRDDAYWNQYNLIPVFALALVLIHGRNQVGDILECIGILISTCTAFIVCGIPITPVIADAIVFICIFI